WTWDRFGDYPTDTPVNPLGDATANQRVARGGSWTSQRAQTRLAFRRPTQARQRDTFTGLRHVRTDGPSCIPDEQQENDLNCACAGPCGEGMVCGVGVCN